MGIVSTPVLIHQTHHARVIERRSQLGVGCSHANSANSIGRKLMAPDYTGSGYKNHRRGACFSVPCPHSCGHFR